MNKTRWTLDILWGEIAQFLRCLFIFIFNAMPTLTANETYHLAVVKPFVLKYNWLQKPEAFSKSRFNGMVASNLAMVGSRLCFGTVVPLFLVQCVCCCSRWFIAEWALMTSKTPHMQDILHFWRRCSSKVSFELYFDKISEKWFPTRNRNSSNQATNLHIVEFSIEKLFIILSLLHITCSRSYVYNLQ